MKLIQIEKAPGEKVSGKLISHDSDADTSITFQLPDEGALHPGVYRSLLKRTLHRTVTLASGQQSPEIIETLTDETLRNETFRQVAERKNDFWQEMDKLIGAAPLPPAIATPVSQPIPEKEALVGAVSPPAQSIAVPPQPASVPEAPPAKEAKDAPGTGRGKIGYALLLVPLIIVAVVLIVRSGNGNEPLEKTVSLSPQQTSTLLNMKDIFNSETGCTLRTQILLSSPDTNMGRINVTYVENKIRETILGTVDFSASQIKTDWGSIAFTPLGNNAYSLTPPVGTSKFNCTSYINNLR